MSSGLMSCRPRGGLVPGAMSPLLAVLAIAQLPYCLGFLPSPLPFARQRPPVLLSVGRKPQPSAVPPRVLVRLKVQTGEEGLRMVQCFPAKFEDLDEILMLDTQAYNGKSLWPRSIYESDLVSENNKIFVLKERGSGEVLGFACLSFVLDECSITNIVVSPKHLRKGCASQLLSHMLQFGHGKGVQHWYLEVRAETNTAAVALYQKFGFVCVGRRKNYYANPKEDALILQKEVDPA